MATPKGVYSGISWTKKNKLAVLRRARKLITSPENWTTGKLRRKNRHEDHFRYCVLGAIEKAVYDEGLAPEKAKSFADGASAPSTSGYKVGDEISLFKFTKARYDSAPDALNDRRGHEFVLEMLDGYIEEVKSGKENKHDAGHAPAASS
jgi:hypothetical protein